VIAGLAALRVLPVAQYPDILPPEVEVQAFYPGANAETVAQTVAAPLDQAINGVDGMLFLRSASAANGALNMTVTFAIGTAICHRVHVRTVSAVFRGLQASKLTAPD
jgi:multidrug efflux pump subunit AcrB